MFTIRTSSFLNAVPPFDPAGEPERSTRAAVVVDNPA
jgi:hypothetical protein